MKKITIFASLFALLACSSQQFANYTCPQIIIPRATTRSYQGDLVDKFQINIVGQESYCYKEEADNRYYAVIAPIFKIRRLEHSTTTNLDVSYYIKTSLNDKDYIGKRVFRQTLTIPQNVKELNVKGDSTINRISVPPYNDFKIYMGIELDKTDMEKSNKMFDIDYRYLTQEEINNQNEIMINRVNLEVLPDEEVIYSESMQKPIVVKKNRPKNDCRN